MENKRLAIFFVEGATEVCFYSHLVSFLSKGKNPDELPSFKFIDMKGENHFEQKASPKALRLYIQKHPAASYDFFFCYDHDLFPEQPPIDWEKAAKGLLPHEVHGHFLSPIEEIEDWFFLDEEGLLKYLRLPPGFDLAPYKKLHASGLRKLFWRQHKVYRKGKRVESLIKALSMEELVRCLQEPLEPLLSFLPPLTGGVC